MGEGTHLTDRLVFSFRVLTCICTRETLAPAFAGGLFVETLPPMIRTELGDGANWNEVIRPALQAAVQPRGIEEKPNDDSNRTSSGIQW